MAARTEAVAGVSRIQAVRLGYQAVSDVLRYQFG
jgi:hypothetical protein